VRRAGSDSHAEDIALAGYHRKSERRAEIDDNTILPKAIVGGGGVGHQVGADFVGAVDAQAQLRIHVGAHD
jgi:hypothetical protein